MIQAISALSIVTGILVLIVGFGFHWIGQIISLVDRRLAIRLGIWEENNLPEYEVYEEALAVADVAIGWTYGIAGIGLILGTSWGYMLAWIPGVILVYHCISFWCWTGNQIRAGHETITTRQPMRGGWFAANIVTGVLALIVASTAG